MKQENAGGEQKAKSNPKIQNSDISRLDKDHGQLSRGVVGGNFEAEKIKTEKQERAIGTDKENRMEEQKAPLKNTDRAFVQVNKDGSPSFKKQ